MHRLTQTLTTRPPLDLALSLAEAGALPGVTLTGDLLLTAATVDGVTAALLIDARLPPGCTLLSEQPLTAELAARFAELAARLLALDDDLRPFSALADADPAFAPLRDQLHGYRPPRQRSAFEAACWAVLARRTPPALARRRHAALAARFGASLMVDGIALTAFPAAARLADAGAPALLPYAGDPRQAALLAALARAFASVDEAWLRGGPLDAVERWLGALPGGPWLAAAVLLHGLGRHERAPLTEPRFLAALAHRYGAGSGRQAACLAARYGPWQGLWARYLLRAAAGLPAAAPAARSGYAAPAGEADRALPARGGAWGLRLSSSPVCAGRS